MYETVVASAVSLLAVLAVLAVLLPVTTRAGLRLRACAVLIGLLPVLVLGAIWPSLHTLIALVVTPAILICAISLAWPAITEGRRVELYLKVCAVLGLISGLEALYEAIARSLA